MINVRKSRSDLCRLALDLGHVESVQKSVRQKTVKPVIKRVVRKQVYKTEFRITHQALRSPGI